MTYLRAKRVYKGIMNMIQKRQRATHNATDKTTGHEYKTNEEEKSSSPNSLSVLETFIGSDTILVDEVDY